MIGSVSKSCADPCHDRNSSRAMLVLRQPGRRSARRPGRGRRTEGPCSSITRVVGLSAGRERGDLHDARSARSRWRASDQRAAHEASSALSRSIKARCSCSVEQSITTAHIGWSSKSVSASPGVGQRQALDQRVEVAGARRGPVVAPSSDASISVSTVGVVVPSSGRWLSARAICRASRSSHSITSQRATSVPSWRIACSVWLPARRSSTASARRSSGTGRGSRGSRRSRRRPRRSGCVEQAQLVERRVAHWRSGARAAQSGLPSRSRS